MTKQTFLKKWILANSMGFLIGYLLYTPIGHGFTGNHGYELNTNQLIAHCIALSVVALILFTFQKSVLKKYVSISATRIIFSTLAFIGLFWFGYYQSFIPAGPDYDILFGYLALGSGMWIGSVSYSKNKLLFLIALLCFPFASFIGALVLFITFTTFDLNMDVQNSTMNHMIFWLVVGVSTGLLGGWLSGLVLFRMLEKEGKT